MKTAVLIDSNIIIDYLIAATAEIHALEVATRNPKDFKSVKAFEPYRPKHSGKG